MNYVVDFLTSNYQRLDLARYGLTERMTSVVLTPRFRASSHVVVLVLSQGQAQPKLVAKTPRLADSTCSLEREARNLRFAQGLHSGGLSTVPRAVAFEQHLGRPVLVQTALLGHPMDPPQMRRSFEHCCSAAMDCLADLSYGPRNQNSVPENRFNLLVSSVLDYLDESFPWNQNERLDLDRTRACLEPLRNAKLPAVLEHGDFSHPNLMLLSDGCAGVVDWEMAEIHGAPCHDLIFFLTYAAFARNNARENGKYLPAIQAAFFGESAWAQAYMLQYAQQLQLPLETLKPLFLLSWVRYIAGLLKRIDETGERVSDETADWMRQNRYYVAWRYTIEHIDELQWTGAG